jgi:hypothetical protein
MLVRPAGIEPVTPGSGILNIIALLKDIDSSTILNEMSEPDKLKHS